MFMAHRFGLLRKKSRKRAPLRERMKGTIRTYMDPATVSLNCFSGLGKKDSAIRSHGVTSRRKITQSKEKKEEV